MTEYTYSDRPVDFPWISFLGIMLRYGRLITSLSVCNLRGRSPRDFRRYSAFDVSGAAFWRFGLLVCNEDREITTVAAQTPFGFSDEYRKAQEIA